MAAGRDALVLANPIGLARQGLTTEGLIALLASEGLEAHVELLTADPDIAQWRERLRALAPSRVIVAGGDGTVHHVVNMVAPLDLPLGILPFGTANDFARALSLPDLPGPAYAVAAGESSRRVDLGRVNGHYFLNAVHLGLGVEAARRIRPALKATLRTAAYALGAAEAFVAREPLTFRVCADDRCFELDAVHLLVGNGRYFGGGMLIAPEATLDDGLLDINVLQSGLGALAAVRLALAARRGRPCDAVDMQHFRTSRLTAHLPRPLEVNLDGEIAALGTRLEFEVAPHALAVFAPSTEREPGRAYNEGGTQCTVA